MTRLSEECVCVKDGKPHCFLYHPKKNYCSLDGKFHTGCIVNFMPIKGDKHNELVD